MPAANPVPSAHSKKMSTHFCDIRIWCCTTIQMVLTWNGITLPSPSDGSLLLCQVYYQYHSTWSKTGRKTRRMRLNVMAHAQKPDFVFQWNGRVHLNRRGPQFSRILAVEVCASAVVMLDTPCREVVWRVLATHCIRHFPLHFPFTASPCAITFQLDSNSQLNRVPTPSQTTTLLKYTKLGQ